MYKDYVDPEFTWSNFTVEEQAKVIVAPRSNNLLDTTRVRGGTGRRGGGCGASVCVWEGGGQGGVAATGRGGLGMNCMVWGMVCGGRREGLHAPQPPAIKSCPVS